LILKFVFNILVKSGLIRNESTLDPNPDPYIFVYIKYFILDPASGCPKEREGGEGERRGGEERSQGEI